MGLPTDAGAPAASPAQGAEVTAQHSTAHRRQISQGPPNDRADVAVATAPVARMGAPTGCELGRRGTPSSAMTLQAAAHLPRIVMRVMPVAVHLPLKCPRAQPQASTSDTSVRKGVNIFWCTT